MNFKFPSLPFAVALFVGAGLGAVAYFLYPSGAAVDGPAVLAGGLFGATLVGALLGGFQAGAASPATATASTGDVTKTIFVGNLAFKASRGDVEALFAAYGPVHSVKIMTERGSRRPRGFCFVEMGDAHADAAIRALNGKEFCGRNLKVSEANDRRPAAQNDAGEPA